MTSVELQGLVPHELRHTAASLAIKSGANIKVVQTMLGHASATMRWDLYGHLYDGDLDNVPSGWTRLARSCCKQIVSKSADVVTLDAAILSLTWRFTSPPS